MQLTSWKSPFDPSFGNFSSSVQHRSFFQVFIWKDGSPLWRSGPWNTRIFIGTPTYNSVFNNEFSLFVDNQDGTVSLSFSYAADNLFQYVLTTEGNMVERYWDNEKDDWRIVWNALNSECDHYGTCGAFGSCTSWTSPICSCLPGFEPKNTEEWNRGNWTSGCSRRTPLQCERVNTTGGEASKMDGFLKLKMMKVPDLADSSPALEDNCRQQCLKNCSCIAYAYDIGTGCMSWTRNLIDIQKFSNGGVDLYIRVAYSELGELFCYLSKFILCFKSWKISSTHCTHYITQITIFYTQVTIYKKIVIYVYYVYTRACVIDTTLKSFTTARTEPL